MDKERKSVLVNYTGRKGGGSVYAYEMTKSLIENGCRVYVILSRDIDNINKWQKLSLEKLTLIDTYSNIVSYLINTFKFKMFGIKRLKKQYTNVHIDVVYVPMIQPWTHLINNVFKNSQKIVTMHDPKPHSGSNRYFDRLCLKAALNADDVVILSEIFRDYAIERFKQEKEHVHVIPHGIFDYYKSVQGYKKCINYDSNNINFLFFGRITKYKGLHILSEAYHKLSMEFDNVTLTVVGNGNFDEYHYEYNTLKNTTIINRWINDEEVGGFFDGKNIVTVLPYTDATQSGIIPIAMEYKSLVIASNTGGLSEQVKDKETGYLFEVNNADDLYKVMKHVVLNYDKQNEIINNALKYIKTLSWDVLGRTLIDIVR